jgi:hypothetical protein
MGGARGGKIDSKQCRLHRKTTKNRWLFLLLGEKPLKCFYLLKKPSTEYNSKRFCEEYMNCFGII